MKKLFCILFIMSSIISFSFGLTQKERTIIKSKNYSISKDSDDSLVLFGTNSILKIQIGGEISPKYVENLNKNELYDVKNIVENKERYNGTVWNSKMFIFTNKEKGIYQFLVKFERSDKRNQQPIIVEGLTNELEEIKSIEEIVKVLMENTIKYKFITLDKKQEYIGILDDVSLYSKKKEIIGNEKESEGFIEKIDDSLSKIKEYKANKKKEKINDIKSKDSQDKGFIEKIDSYLDLIKKYKASKLPFFSNEIPEYNIKISQDGFVYDITTGKLASGIITKRYYNGVIIFEQKVKDGLADGKHREYYIDSEGKRLLKTIGKYKKGEKEGTWKEYYLNGQLQEIAKYENGKLEGKYKSYYRNKKLESEGEFEKGNKEGTWIFYYENGEKKSEGKYRDDEKVRKWKYYNTNGKIDKEVRYTFF